MKKKLSGIFIGTTITIIKDGKVQNKGTIKSINRDWTGTYLHLKESNQSVRIVR